VVRGTPTPQGRRRVEKALRRQAVEEARELICPDIDKALLKVLPPDHPEVKRIKARQEQER